MHGDAVRRPPQNAMQDAMKLKLLLPALLRLAAAAIALAPAAIASAPQPTQAQGVVVLVNGDPITNFDIEQRSKLIQMSTQKTPARHDVIEELINEKLKIQLIKRYMIPDIDKDVDSAFANMARRMRQSPKDFTDHLAKTGLNVETLKSRIRADIIWTQIIRGRYQASFQFTDRDIQSRIEAKNPQGAAATTQSYDYTLRPILFVVPRGSSPEAYQARAKEAEALRAQFRTCEDGIPMARNVRFVAVRAPVTRNTSDLPPALREILTKTEIGRLTPPETTQQGIEVYAVCSRRESDNAVEKKEARDQLYNEVFESRAKAFLKELRSQAMIEYKQ
jgi:peptidyl-prolyl cis-trans isomerase SurA